MMPVSPLAVPASADSVRAGSQADSVQSTLAAGVTLTRYVTGRPAPRPWTVAIRSASARTRLADAAEVRKVRRQLRKRRAKVLRKGLVVRTVRTPAMPGLRPRVLGRTIRLGKFAHAAKARRLAARLSRGTRRAPAVRATVLARADDGARTRDVRRIQSLRADPAQAAARVTTGIDVSGTETVRSMAAGTIAGVNGGFFHLSSRAPGDAVGALVQNGTLLSTDAGRRSALLLGHGRPRVTELRARMRIRGPLAPGWSRTGLNAWPAADALTVFTTEYGRTLPPITGREVLFDPVTGVVAQSTRRRAGDPPTVLPPALHAVQGRGAGAEWLAAYAPPATTLRVRPSLRDLRRAAEVELTPGLHAVNGNVTLVRGGRVHINAQSAGVAARWDAFYDMVMRRHPRTLAGVDRAGRLMLVTVDGRRPGYSAGMTLPEAAALMRRLGAVDAVNLDGGGSTTMVSGGRLVNRPSGAERRVGSAVVIGP